MNQYARTRLEVRLLLLMADMSSAWHKCGMKATEYTSSMTDCRVAQRMPLRPSDR
jgi:hypothetical protein